MRAAEDIPAGQPEHLFLNRLLDRLPDLHVHSDQTTNQEHRLFFAAIGRKTVVADLHKPGRQHMEKKTPDELHGVQGHGFDRIVVGPVPVGEGHPAVVYGFDPMIADGDSVGVAAQVGQDLLRPGKRLFGIYDPLFFPGLIQQGFRVFREIFQLFQA